MLRNKVLNKIDYLGRFEIAPEKMPDTQTLRGTLKHSKMNGFSAAMGLIAWVEFFEEFLYNVYQQDFQADGIPGVYQVLHTVPSVRNATTEQLEDLENAIVSTLDLGVTPTIWKLKRCEEDSKTGCKFFWEGVDRGGYPPHTQYLVKHFKPPFGVIVQAPDGDWASFDGGRPYGIPRTVYELKTGREWAGIINYPMNKWAPILLNIYNRDAAQFAKQARIAMKCSLGYQIWINTAKGAAGYSSKLPGYSIRHVP